MAHHHVGEGKVLGANEKWHLVHFFDREGHYAIRSFHGTYLAAGHPTHNVSLVPEHGAAEMWHIEEHADHKVALKSHHGTFLRSHPNGEVDLSTTLGEAELWTKLPLEGDHLFAFFSHHGQFLSAK